MSNESFYIAPSTDGSFIIISKRGDNEFILPSHYPHASLLQLGADNTKEIEDLQKLNIYSLYGKGKFQIAKEQLKKELGKFIIPILDWLNKILSK